MKLPEIRQFGWTLKRIESAYIESKTLSTGQMEIIIKHDIIKGISTDMLYWWFKNFARLFVIIDSKKYPALSLRFQEKHFAQETPCI
jgi:hypothetical protein